MQGAYTAQHEINQNGGVAGRKLVLELANDASGASGAAEAAKAAAQDSKRAWLHRLLFQRRTKAALPYTADAGIPHIAATASNPSLNGSPYFFRICPSDVVQGQQLATLCPDDAAERQVQQSGDRGVPRSRRLLQQRAGRPSSPPICGPRPR